MRPRSLLMRPALACLPLALLALSSCLVPGLEVGPGQEPAARAGSAGLLGSAGSHSPGLAGSGGMPALGGGAPGVAGVTGVAGALGGSPGSGVGADGGVGSVGVGGAGDDVVVRCEDHPISDKTKWSVTASSSSLGTGKESDPLYNPPGHVADGALDSRWASGQPQDVGQWFHVDFGVEVALSHVILQQGRDIEDFPRGYEISVSDRHTDFDATARATGHGASVSEAVIPLDQPALGRYLLIKQTGSAKSWWSIAEISVECH